MTGIALCMRVASATPAPDAWGSGWIHSVTPTPHEQNDALRIKPPAPLTDERADARHVLYGALAQHPFSRLNAEDRADLHRCGLTDEAITRHGYFTYSDASGLGQIMRDLERLADHQRSPIARQWRKAHHGHLLQTELWALPGVYAAGTRGGTGFVNRLVKAHAATGEGALGIPVRDADQRIVAIQLRHRNSDRTNTGVPRYTLLSTRQAPSGSPIHVARPRTLTNTVRIVITEGTVKANIAADILGSIVIGLPGVASKSGVVETLQRLRRRGELTDETQVLIAFDAEAVPEKIASITAARERLAQMLAEQDFHVSLAEWDAANGKGIDDLLVAGQSFTEHAYERKARRGLVQCDDIASVSFSATHTTLESASAALKDLVEQLIPVRNWPRDARAWHVVRAITGLGKTATILRRLHQLTILDGGAHWPLVRNLDGTTRPTRVLYLCDTIESLREKSQEHLGATWRMVMMLAPAATVAQSRQVWQPRTGDDYWVAEGRNPAPESTAYCGNPQAAAIGEKRHLVPVDVCGNKEHPCPRKASCEQSGYLSSKKRAKQHRLVLATKAAYLNGSEELGQFDLVILDEDAAAWLLETLQVAPQDVLLWRRLLTQRDTSGTYALLDRFLDWLQKAANHAAVHVERNREQPALVALRQTAPDDAMTLLRAAIGSCDRTVNQDLHRALCELPQDGQLIPLRAIYDLAMTLIQEWTRPDDADSRLRYASCGTLIMRRPFMHLINILAQRRVLWLDATADVSLIKHMAQMAQPYTKRLVSVEVHDLTVTPDVAVWQMTDSRFSVETLRRESNRELRAIAETITSVARGRGIDNLRSVAVLARKPFDPTAEET